MWTLNLAVIPLEALPLWVHLGPWSFPAADLATLTVISTMIFITNGVILMSCDLKELVLPSLSSLA